VNEQEIFTRLGLALGIGLLIGLERGWRERVHAEGERTAGLRTFALIGFSGGVWALVADRLGAVTLAVAFLAFAAGFTLFKWRESEREGDLGATTLVAGLLTFGLGAYAVLGSMAAAAAAGVVTAALLAAKAYLHDWIEALTWQELRATLILLAMSFVALPVLPDHGFGPYEALNPASLWLMTVAIAGVSFIGYVAVRLTGDRYGTLIAGIAGGVVSSTAATLDTARKARARPKMRRIELAGALVASTVMFLRVLLIVALFGASHLAHLAGPLVAAAAVSFAAALALFGAAWSSRRADGDDGPVFTNPFDLLAVLRFAALLAVILVASKGLTAAFGGRGITLLAAATGLADVDAITLSITRIGASVSAVDAEIAILVAVAANSLSKSAIALFVGGRGFGLMYLGLTAVAVAVGGGVAWLTLGAG
jgi:uncharacterized membrane protein (DUF4010 family)